MCKSPMVQLQSSNVAYSSATSFGRLEPHHGSASGICDRGRELVRSELQVNEIRLGIRRVPERRRDNMKQSAGNQTQTRERLTLNNNIQNVTVLPEPYMAGNHLDEDQRLLSIHSHTNESTVARQSGIVPGIVAAAIFIAFLLGLYTVLWKCMSFQNKRHKGNRRTKQKTNHSATVSCRCKV
ncbi:uncharacterized protein sb:cb288 [Heterodontus francisci]|uniref:uncharacterized protein sb:cb288 n=1 Tax=Heterodontus francisci TaxID=7792 RepID=UPI00355C6A2A